MAAETSSSAGTTSTARRNSSFTTRGKLLHDSSASILGGFGFLDFEIVGQAEGYVGDGFMGISNPYVEALAADGTVTAMARYQGWGTGKEDPLGGVVEWVSDGEITTSTGTLFAFDTKGSERWHLKVAGSGPFATLGVDRAGNILVLFQQSGDRAAFDGAWVSHDGVAQGGSFLAYRNPSGAISCPIRRPAGSPYAPTRSCIRCTQARATR